MFQPEEIDLKSYGRLLARRRRLVLLTVAAFVALAIVLNTVTEPVYRATTRLEVGKEPNRSPLTGEAIASDGWNSDNVALFTTAELVTNRTLLREVVGALRASGELRMEPSRRKAARNLMSRVLGSPPVVGPTGIAFAGQTTQETGPGDAEVGREIDWLLGITTVKPINETRLVTIQVDHWEPWIAKAIADTLAHRFVAYEERKRNEADSNRLVYLRQQLEEVRGRIEGSERILYSSHQLGLSVLDGRLKQLSETIANLNEAYLKAKTDRLAAEARLNLVRAALKDGLASSDGLPIQDESVQGLYKELLQTRTELARAREVYKSKHPRIMVLESQLQSTQENIRTELNKAVATLEADYAMLKGREDSLRASIDQSENELRDTNDRQGQHTALESELKSNRDLYTLLMAKVQEVEIGGEVRQPLVDIVEAATLSPEPVRPRKALNLALGLIVGLMSGAGLALLTEYLRRTVKTPRDVTQVLELPILGMIPRSQQ